MSYHLAYLFSRYPVPSQTFCDTEMMALERMGWKITVGALNGPTSSFRHDRLQRLAAEQVYPPPGQVLDLPGEGAAWERVQALAAEHTQHYGASYKAELRARNAWWFAQELKRRGITHVHVHFANRATHTALFLKELGITFSFTAHAQDFMIDLGSNALLQEMAREAEFVVAVSDYSKALLQDLCPDSAAKIHRVHNGLDPAEFEAAPLPPRGPVFRIVSIGRLIEFKGFHTLLDSIAELKRRNRSVQLDIIGEGPQREMLEHKIRELGLEDSVFLRGLQGQDAVRKLLVESHCFALACEVDAKGASDILPTVILEAMAIGRPVVSTQLVGVPEMVLDGETGLLVPPGDSMSMANALDALIQQPSISQRMAVAGRQWFLQRFTLDHSAGALEQLFKGVLETRQIPSLVATTKVLGLAPQWPLPLGEQSPLPLLYADSVAKPGGSLPAEQDRFVPDALVLESFWRGNPDMVAKVEALYHKCGNVPGEFFFREARRAVWLALQIPHWGVQRVHAWRSDQLLWAWLTMKLTGVSGTFLLEPKPQLSRSALDAILGDFAAGCVADEKVAERWGQKFPDRSQLREPEKKGMFAKKTEPTAPDHRALLAEWMKL
jgi:glycosyltransferase involved in cell wall biosynthesis